MVIGGSNVCERDGPGAGVRQRIDRGKVPGTVVGPFDIDLPRGPIWIIISHKYSSFAVDYLKVRKGILCMGVQQDQA